MKEPLSRVAGFKTDSFAIAGMPECKHHWVIESPRGPVSVGTCKNCKLEKEFWNSMPTTGWERRNEKGK